jgi:hypothetical protein
MEALLGALRRSMSRTVPMNESPIQFDLLRQFNGAAYECRATVPR